MNPHRHRVPMPSARTVVARLAPRASGARADSLFGAPSPAGTRPPERGKASNAGPLVRGPSAPLSAGIGTRARIPNRLH